MQTLNTINLIWKKGLKREEIYEESQLLQHSLIENNNNPRNWWMCQRRDFPGRENNPEPNCPFGTFLTFLDSPNKILTEPRFCGQNPGSVDRTQVLSTEPRFCRQNLVTVVKVWLLYIYIYIYRSPGSVDRTRVLSTEPRFCRQNPGSVDRT